MRWKELLNPLDIKTPICKVCGNPIKYNNFHILFHPNTSICGSCYGKFEILDERYKLQNCPTRILFRYSSEIKNSIYQFKANGDYELREVFFEYLLNDLRFEYRDHVVVPAPSSPESDAIRGFNHAEELFAQLNLPIVKAIIKTSNREQKEQSLEGRKEIGKYFALTKIDKIRNKKVLIVDDVYTSGSTINAMIKLVKKAQPKSIKILILSKQLHNQEDRIKYKRN